jgi:ribosome maturation factor RimP
MVRTLAVRRTSEEKLPQGARVKRFPQVEEDLERRVAGLGFELVELAWAGTPSRPILRIRMDVPGEGSSGGVTVADCARVSRALESWLDALPAMPERYVLEVSSPGVERPLTRTRDWTRFAGRRVAVRGEEALAGRAKRLEGDLLGVEHDEGQRELIRLRLTGGEEVDIPREEILEAHVVFQWK